MRGPVLAEPSLGFSPLPVLDAQESLELVLHLWRRICP